MHSPRNDEGRTLRTPGPSEKTSTINRPKYTGHVPVRKATPEELHRALCQALFDARKRPWPGPLSEHSVISTRGPIDWTLPGRRIA